ncbi:MAG TPA: sugar ABC transporter substrate-binding protein [Armatimonadota bacterium]
MLKSGRWPAVLACTFAVIVVLTGCNRSNVPNQNTRTTKVPHVALIMKSLSNEFFKTMEDGAKAHHKQHASEYQLTVNGIKDELDVSKQVELVERMVAQGVDAIVIAPADSKALVNVCKKAADAGIVVVNIDNRFDSGALKDSGLTAPFVGPNNRAGAKKVGDVLAKKLKPGDSVAILEGAPNSFNGVERKLGFEDAMKASGIKVVTSQSAYWETDKANEMARNIITSHPDIKALLCANDSMALGAVRAVEEAGKAGQIAVVGYDNIQAVNEYVKDGGILATADQHADRLAVYGIEYALKMVKGEKDVSDKETPVDLVTASGQTAQ